MTAPEAVGLDDEMRLAFEAYKNDGFDRLSEQIKARMRESLKLGPNERLCDLTRDATGAYSRMTTRVDYLRWCEAWRAGRAAILAERDALRAWKSKVGGLHSELERERDAALADSARLDTALRDEAKRSDALRAQVEEARGALNWIDAHVLNAGDGEINVTRVHQTALAALSRMGGQRE